jgi:hypothetical protein
MKPTSWLSLWDASLFSFWHPAFSVWRGGKSLQAQAFQTNASLVFSLPSWQETIERFCIKEHPYLPPTPDLPHFDSFSTGPILDMTGQEAHLVYDQVVVKPFFEGSFGLAALLKALIHQRPPTVGWAAQKTTGGPWFVLDQATLAIRSPLALRVALMLTGARLFQMLPRSLERIHQATEIFKPVPAGAMPSTWDYAKLALRQGLNRLQRIVTKPFFRINHWEIALSSKKNPGWKPIPTTKNAFHADPFLFSHQGKTWLFFEYFVYSTGKATIAVREVYDDLSVGPLQVVLDPPHHLSYPVILEYEDSLYMIPCTSRDGVEVYRAVSFPHEWVLDRVMLPDLPIADVTPLFHEGRWWLFGSLSYPPTPNWDEVFVFYSDSLFGPWQPHAKNPVKAHALGARPAGNFFYHEGRLYRPGQNCQGGYGQSVVFFEVITLTPNLYHEIPIEKPAFIPDTHRRWHTYNQIGDFQVIDLKVPKRLF